MKAYTSSMSEHFPNLMSLLCNKQLQPYFHLLELSSMWPFQWTINLTSNDKSSFQKEIENK